MQPLGTTISGFSAASLPPPLVPLPASSVGLESTPEVPTDPSTSPAADPLLTPEATLPVLPEPSPVEPVIPEPPPLEPVSDPVLPAPPAPVVPDPEVSAPVLADPVAPDPLAPVVLPEVPLISPSPLAATPEVPAEPDEEPSGGVPGSALHAPNMAALRATSKQIGEAETKRFMSGSLSGVRCRLPSRAAREPARQQLIIYYGTVIRLRAPFARFCV